MRIRDVARRLRLSESAVRAHCSFAYRRLGVTGQGQAVVLLVREGWLDGHPGPAVPEDFRASPTQQSYLAAFDRFVREGRRADRRLMQIGLIAMRCERRRHPDQAMEERDAGIERLIDRIAS
jgi:hypothetical protein